MPDNNTQQQSYQDDRSKAEADAKARADEEASQAVNNGLMNDPVSVAICRKLGNLRRRSARNE